MSASIATRSLSKAKAPSVGPTLSDAHVKVLRDEGVSVDHYENRPDDVRPNPKLRLVYIKAATDDLLKKPFVVEEISQSDDHVRDAATQTKERLRKILPPKGWDESRRGKESPTAK